MAANDPGEPHRGIPVHEARDSGDDRKRRWSDRQYRIRFGNHRDTRVVSLRSLQAWCARPDKNRRRRERQLGGENQRRPPGQHRHPHAPSRHGRRSQCREDDPGQPARWTLRSTRGGGGGHRMALLRPSFFRLWGLHAHRRGVGGALKRPSLRSPQPTSRSTSQTSPSSTRISGPGSNRRERPSQPCPVSRSYR